MADEITLYENDVDVYGWVVELQRLLDSQGHPSSDPSGEFHSATTEAVKAFQRANHCDDDGIVGNQTWSALYGRPLAPEGIANQPYGDTREQRTGLSRDGAVDEYVDHTYGTTYSSMSAVDRANSLLASANEQLVSAGVPPIQSITWTATGGTWATFHFPAWALNLNPTNFDPNYYDTLTADQQNDVAVAVYHESRHAEQWYRMARERAGLGASHADLVGLGYPGDIAMLAIGDPILQCDRSQYESEQWYESVYGAGAAHRDTTLSDPGASYDDYRELPEERDAWGVESQVERAYDEAPQP